MTEALGSEPEPIVLSGEEAPRPLRWVRARLDLALRTDPRPDDQDSRARGTLPQGAIVVALGGELGQRGSRATTSTVLGRGHVAARLLVPLEGCVPPRPPGFDARSLTARAQVFHRRSRRDAALFVRREGRNTRVEVHGLTDACELEERLLSIAVPGRAADVRLTRSASSGGETLLVVGAPRGGRAVYRVFRLGRRRAIFERAVENASEETVQIGVEDGGAWYPLVVDGQRLRWTGRGLEP